MVNPGNDPTGVFAYQAVSAERHCESKTYQRVLTAPATNTSIAKVAKPTAIHCFWIVFLLEKWSSITAVD